MSCFRNDILRLPQCSQQGRFLVYNVKQCGRGGEGKAQGREKKRRREWALESQARVEVKGKEDARGRRVSLYESQAAACHSSADGPENTSK